MRITTAGRFAALTGGAALVVGTTLALAGPAFAASSAEVQVTGDQIAPDESTYTGWHEGYKTPGARATVTAAGLNLTGPSQIINGLANPITVDGTSQKLADIVAGTGFTSTKDAVYYQIAIFATIGLDGAKNTDFTTLRPAVPGQAGLKDLWVSSKDITVELPTVEPTTEPTDTIAPSEAPTTPATEAPSDKKDEPEQQQTTPPVEPSDDASDDAPVSFSNTSGFSIKTASVVTPKAALADGVILANTPTTLADLDAALGSFQVLAFGVLANTAESDTVQTVSFGGTVYRFNTVTAAADPVATPAAAPVKRLSNTGAETTPLIAGGAVLLAAGLAAMAIARKRHQQA